jgi:hypothetical protein
MSIFETGGSAARAGLLHVLVAVLLAVLVLLATLFGSEEHPAALLGPEAARAAVLTGSDGEVLIGFGEDVYLAEGEVVDVVLSFGGQARIDGRVRQGVFVFGGDVIVGPEAVIGIGISKDDVTVAVFGGEQVELHGSEVRGRSLDATALDLGWIVREDGLQRGAFRSGTAAWGVGLLVWLLIAYLASIIAPRQVAAVKEVLAARPWGSLGWGALTALVIVPLTSFLLILTVVGILALVPALTILLPLLLVVGYLGAAAWVGGLILARAATPGSQAWVPLLTGIVALHLVALVPVLGALALAVISLAGFGAALLALRGWRQRRRAPQVPPAAGSVDSTRGAPVAG